VLVCDRKSREVRGGKYGILASGSLDLLNFNLSRGGCITWNPSRTKSRQNYLREQEFSMVLKEDQQGADSCSGRRENLNTEAEFFAETVGREGRVSGRDVKGEADPG